MTNPRAPRTYDLKGQPADLDHPAVAEATVSCPARPEAYTGTLNDGRHFYFRFRWGLASLEVWTDSQDNAVTVEVETGDDGQGEFDSDAHRNRAFASLYEQVSR